jgi:hypothetical protein
MATPIARHDCIKLSRSATGSFGNLATGTLRATVLLGALLILASPAKADQITTFGATGTFASTTTTMPFSGTVTIDTTTGVVDDLFLKIQATPTIKFNLSPPEQFVVPQEGPNGEVWLEGPSLSRSSDLFLVIPVGSLVGYTGGFLGGDPHVPFDLQSFYSSNGEGQVDLVAGVLTVPEPTFIMLLVSGGVIAGGLYFVQRARVFEPAPIR